MNVKIKKVLKAMSKKTHSTHEFYIKCPLYSKGLKVCPSAKDRLEDGDMLNLTSYCVTEKYKNCNFYLNRKESEQAA